jgi:hypothetical protein
VRSVAAEIVALPAQGAFFFDARGSDRALRVTRHDEAGVVVLSVWRDDACVATCRLAESEAGALAEFLADCLPASHGTGSHRAAP